MKLYGVTILPSAEREIEEAFLWLSERDKEAAIRWYNQLLTTICSLETFPERCPLAPESSFFKSEIRQIFHGRKQHKYRILFHIDLGEVYVLHVRHGARLQIGGTEPL